MKVIGLLMVKEESDILPETLPLHDAMVDCFYALDGTLTDNVSRALITGSDKCAGYFRDEDFGEPCDGRRSVLLQLAYSEHGHDNLFALLHADEVWTASPRAIAAAHPYADGFMFRLPLHYQPAAWDWTRGPVEQMTASLHPGYPEFRMFRGAPDRQYSPRQHFNVQPRDCRELAWVTDPIRHYPFRSLGSQLVRKGATFDPDNYADCPLTGAEISAKYLGRSQHYIRERMQVEAAG